MFKMSIILIKYSAFSDTCISQGAIQDDKKAEDKMMITQNLRIVYAILEFKKLVLSVMDEAFYK